MKNDKIVSQVLSSVLVGGLIIGGVAFAGEIKSNSNQVQDNKVSFSKLTMEERAKLCKNKRDIGLKKRELVQQTLDSLLKAGVFDQKKVNEIKAYFEKKDKEREARMKELEKLSPEERNAFFKKKFADRRTNKREKRGNFLNELVKDKIITQKEAQAFNDNFQDILKSKQHQRFSQVLKDLVAQRIINQDQADKIIKEFEASHNERKTLEGKLNKNPIKKLVEEKIITEKQANQIRQALNSHKCFHKRFYKDMKYHMNKK